MRTHLKPVAETLTEARSVAGDRLKSNRSIPWWDIRRGHDGFYVVPPMKSVSGDRWLHDPGYESVGSLVERVEGL